MRLTKHFRGMSIALRLALFSSLLAVSVFPAEKSTAPQLIELAKSNSPALHDAITATFDAKDLKDGTAWAGRGPEFFFVIDSSSQPSLVIDGAPGPQLRKLSGSSLWYVPARIEQVGRLHSFHYLIDGKKFGGRLDLPAFGPLSYLQPGVPSGTLSPKITHTSKIYDGMKADYWIYVPAQYDKDTPAALMVFQDGGWYTDRNGNNPTLNVIDNLIGQKKIPVMICVFINPGDITDSPDTPTYRFVKAYSDKWQRTLKDSMRSTLYDTVSDRYVRYLRNEVLVDVAAKYNIRTDAYSRAITGLSSGAICAFNAAWQMPDQFSRVISWIGSFASIQWRKTLTFQTAARTFPTKSFAKPNATSASGSKTAPKTSNSTATAVGRSPTFASRTPSSSRTTTSISASAKAPITLPTAPPSFPPK